MLLSVEKIGGTSMSKMEAVLDNIVFFDQKKQLNNRVFVVSAYAGITNMLLENRKTAEPGIYSSFCAGKDYTALLKELQERLFVMNNRFISLGLNTSVANSFIVNRINKVGDYLESLSNVLASGYVAPESIFPAAREILASIGEVHAAFNMNNMIAARNVNTAFVDLSGFDDSFPFSIDQRIAHEFGKVNLNASLAVTTGYCKGTEGIMREFDRGYSDVTFSKIAVALNANQAIIHKEYHLSTADPEIVGADKCRPISRLNFNIADQLADIGMQAIHPKASKPLELAGISLCIKNTFQPGHAGTLISGSVIPDEGKVDMISGNEKVFIFEIIDPFMVGAVGFDESIMGVLKQFRISYIMKTTSANSISIVIFRKDASDVFIETLKRNFLEVRTQNCALISILGISLKKTGILAKTASILADKQIDILSVGIAYSQVNLQLVVAETEYEPAVRLLHKGFFETNSQSIK